MNVNMREMIEQATESEYHQFLASAQKTIKLIDRKPFRIRANAERKLELGQTETEIEQERNSNECE